MIYYFFIVTYIEQKKELFLKQNKNSETSRSKL